MAHKYATDLMHPIEAGVYCSTERLVPLFQSLGVTPNQLTATSFAFSIACALCASQRNYGLAAGAYLGAFLFDCWDGGYARLTNQCTPFGDFFDHFSDWAGMALLIFGLARSGIVRELTATERVAFAALFAISALLLLLHVSCEVKLQRDAGVNNQPSLDFLGDLSPHNPEHVLGMSRWFGYTGLHGAVLLTLLYLSAYH